MYINDIADGVQSQLRLFADDCIIYKTINSLEDHTILQEDINQLCKWANICQMEFNLSKCNILRISHLHNCSSYTYAMYNTQLKLVKEHKYLGVWINESLSWRKHISYTCNKANRTLGFPQRNLRTCPIHLKAQACKQLIFPLLESNLAHPPYNRDNQTWVYPL